MTALHSITAFESNPECPRHDYDGLVCEEHPDRPWNDHPNPCGCGAPGMPCVCSRWACGSVGSSCECAS